MPTLALSPDEGERAMRILLAFDGSEHSEEALASIAARPWPTPLTVTILHALDLRAEFASQLGLPVNSEGYATLLSQTRAAATNRVADARARLSARLPQADIRTHVADGSPAATVVQVAADTDADLIVLGAHGYGAVARVLLGSVSNKVALQARCAVEIVKTTADASPPGFRLLLATDFSATAARALENVQTMPWPESTEVRLVTSMPPLQFLSAAEVGGHEALREIEMARAARRSVEDKLAKLREELGSKFGAACVTSEVLDGDPRNVLVDVAAQWRASLIVLGSHGRTGLKHLLLGSVAQGVLHAAPCSVRIVK
jgi:nucleotide-binding universal stress UspA family protein